MKWLKVAVATLILVGVASAQSVWHEWATDSPDDSVYADTTGYDQYTRDIIAGTDLDQDGKPEVMFTDYKNGGRLHVFELVAPETLQEVWTYQFPASGYYSTTRSLKVGDLDGDGNGEILVAYTGPSGDTTYAGLYVFEWNGTDNGYGNPDGTPSTRIVDFAFEYDSTGNLIYPDQYRSEDIAVGDFDGDGIQEVLWVNNASTPFDNAYIFSIAGDVSSFYITQPETTIKRRGEGFGGSTISGFGPVDINGNNIPEAVIMIWNHVGLALVEGVGPDQYNIIYHVEGLDPNDLYSYAKAVNAVDIDNDGKQDLVIGGLLRNRFYVVRNTSDNTFVVDTVNFDTLDTNLSIYSLRAGDLDGDGTPNIYIGSLSEGFDVLSHTGGALNDPANWTKEVVWDNFRRDTLIVDTTDTAGNPIQDTLVVRTQIGPNLALADLDGDGNGEGIFVTQESGDVAAIPYTYGFLHVVEYGPQHSVEEWTILPPKGSTIELYAATPNPFRDRAQISFYVPSRTNVTLNIYDATGRLVKTLVKGTVDAGRHSVIWNGTDNSGHSVSEGIYIYRLSANGESRTGRVVLVK